MAEFADKWIKENEEGCPNFNNLLNEGKDHPIESVGKNLRSMMPWFDNKNTEGSQADY